MGRRLYQAGPRLDRRGAGSNGQDLGCHGPHQGSEGACWPASTVGPAEGHAQHRSIPGGVRLGPVNRRCLVLRCVKAACVQVCLAVEPSRERLSRLTIPSCSLFQVQCTCSVRASLPILPFKASSCAGAGQLVYMPGSLLERHACKHSTCHACLYNCEPERDKLQRDYPRAF